MTYPSLSECDGLIKTREKRLGDSGSILMSISADDRGNRSLTVAAPMGVPGYFLGAPGAAPRPGLPVGEVQPAGGLYSARVLVLPADGKSAGAFCVTLPVAAHSVPRW